MRFYGTIMTGLKLLWRKTERDGQPLDWAKVLLDKDKTHDRDNGDVQEIAIQILATKYEDEFEAMIQKWTQAKSVNKDVTIPTIEIIDGVATNKFDHMVLQRIGQQVELHSGNVDNNRFQKGIDFNGIPHGNAKGGYITPPPPWRRSPTSPGSSGPGPGVGGQHTNNFNLGAGGGGADDPDEHGDPLYATNNEFRSRDTDVDRRSREFKLVNH